MYILAGAPTTPVTPDALNAFVAMGIIGLCAITLLVMGVLWLLGLLEDRPAWASWLPFLGQQALDAPAAPRERLPYVAPPSLPAPVRREPVVAPVPSPLDDLLDPGAPKPAEEEEPTPVSVIHVDEGPRFGPLPLAEWVAYANSRPHLLVCSQTGGGKSTMVRYFLRQRLLANELLVIIDPHWAPKNWWGLPGAGGAEDFDEIKRALVAVSEEYQARLIEHKAGREDFTRLTVVIDEAVTIKTHFDALKGDTTWTKFVAVLGSGARKVAISVVVMTQSPNVDDLGVSGPLRENYARICLDGPTIRTLVERDDFRRRRVLGEMLAGQGAFPAAMEIQNNVYYLDRREVLDVEKPLGAEQRLWDGWYGPPPALATAQAALPGLDAAPETLDTETLLRLLVERGWGKSRDELVALLVAHGWGPGKIRELIKVDNNQLGPLVRSLRDGE